MEIKTFVFMGRPGSGKGMQSKLLSEKLGIPIFSSGARIRELSKSDSALGRKVKEISESGRLVPHWFASFLFEEILFNRPEREGAIFEGVGRKEPEARLFVEINEWLERDYRIIHLDVSEDSVVKRLLKRKEIEGRPDDTEEKIRVRLEHFENETRGALSYFESIGKVLHVDGEPLPDEVFANVLKALDDHA